MIIRVIMLTLLLSASGLSEAFFIQNESGLNWGFWAHRRINLTAVWTLPESPLFAFFKSQRAYLEEHAVDPDKRRYAMEGEAPRHYIDIDHYGPWPHGALPRNWDSAVAVFSEDTLMAYGIGPWHLEKMMGRLTWAFTDGDHASILKLASDLGHYWADLHVPLHCTHNYNGQLTGQHGIHGFWESRLPELFAEDYDYFVGRAHYMPDWRDRIWEVVLESSAAVDSVLSLERLSAEFTGADQLYRFAGRGASIQRQRSEVWSTAYHAALDGMVERRMRSAIRDIGCFWYTAWVDAGRPDLGETRWPVVLPADSSLQRAWQEGAIKGREHW